jgi:hypothetical protein
MYYLYSYVEGNKPYYIGKGKGKRAYVQENHSIPVPNDLTNIHFISSFDDNTKSLLREWEMITFLQLKREGGMLENKVKGCCPPDRTGSIFRHTEEAKQRMRKPKNYVRTPEHAEKIARQVRGRKHTEEWKRTASIKRKGNKNCLGKTNRALTYIITFPDGTQKEIYNMAKFCEEYNLSRACMCNVAKGKGKQHRGYTVSYK